MGYGGFFGGDFFLQPKTSVFLFSSIMVHTCPYCKCYLTHEEKQLALALLPRHPYPEEGITWSLTEELFEEEFRRNKELRDLVRDVAYERYHGHQPAVKILLRWMYEVAYEKFLKGVAEGWTDPFWTLEWLGSRSCTKLMMGDGELLLSK